MASQAHSAQQDASVMSRKVTLGTPTHRTDEGDRNVREVRFATTNDGSLPPSHSPVPHPKNKVLKRKNTPATLPKVDKLNAREQGTSMSSFAEEGMQEAEEEEGDDEHGDVNGGGGASEAAAISDVI